ncbi:MAG: hypothetical protein ACRCYR_11835 [Phycicoccus sp.]
MSSATAPTGFRITPADLADIVLPVGHTGLPLGRGVSGQWEGAEVVLDVFRPQPTSIASFLDVGATALLARRLQQAGAAVYIASREPGWQALLRLSRADARPVQTVDSPDDVPAGSFLRPVAWVGAGRPLVGEEHDRDTQPWTASLVTLPGVDLRATTQARQADVTLVGRCDIAAAQTLSGVLELRGNAAATIAALDDAHVVVVVGRTPTVVSMEASVEELRLRAAAAGWQRTRPRRSARRRQS